MKTNTDHLRKKVRKMMIDADLGWRATGNLARALGLNLQSLSMALTGYRSGPREKDILLKVKRHLEIIRKKKSR